MSEGKINARRSPWAAPIVGCMVGLVAISTILVWWRLRDDAPMKAAGSSFLEALGERNVVEALRYATPRYAAVRSAEEHAAFFDDLGVLGNKGFGAERYSALGRGLLRYVVIGPQGQPVPVVLHFAWNGKHTPMVDAVGPQTSAEAPRDPNAKADTPVRR